MAVLKQMNILHNLMECQKGQKNPLQLSVIMELNIDNRTANLIYGAPVSMHRTP